MYQPRNAEVNAFSGSFKLQTDTHKDMVACYHYAHGCFLETKIQGFLHDFQGISTPFSKTDRLRLYGTFSTNRLLLKSMLQFKKLKLMSFKCYMLKIHKKNHYNKQLFNLVQL